MTADREWEELCRKERAAGYASLTCEEKVWLNVRALIDSIENGGLISYFYNSHANRLADCFHALRELGAADVRREVELLCALFPGGVPEDQEARNEIISAWPDEPSQDAFLEEVDRRLMPAMPALERRLESYLRVRGVIG